MATCPQCQRPVAVARARCLYCGAALDPELRPPVPVAAAPALPPPAEERAIVVVDTTAVDAETLSRALTLSALEAAQRTGRGWQLHRITSPAEAETEAARLRAAGLKVLSLSAQETRPALQPCLAEGGRQVAGGLELWTDRGPAPVHSEDVLVVVAGPIHRELQSEEARRHRRPRTLDAGYRFHVHLRHDPCPIEIDPSAFAFDEPRHPPRSSWLELQGWLYPLPEPGGVDEGFRLVPPALGVAVPSSPGDLTGALAARRKPRRGSGPAVLDNLAQFRFYSGWRAGALRGAARG